MAEKVSTSRMPCVRRAVSALCQLPEMGGVGYCSVAQAPHTTTPLPSHLFCALAGSSRVLRHRRSLCPSQTDFARRLDRWRLRRRRQLRGGDRQLDPSQGASRGHGHARAWRVWPHHHAVLCAVGCHSPKRELLTRLLRGTTPRARVFHAARMT